VPPQVIPQGCLAVRRLEQGNDEDESKQAAAESQHHQRQEKQYQPGTLVLPGVERALEIPGLLAMAFRQRGQQALDIAVVGAQRTVGAGVALSQALEGIGAQRGDHNAAAAVAGKAGVSGSAAAKGDRGPVVGPDTENRQPETGEAAQYATDMPHRLLGETIGDEQDVTFQVAG